MIKDKLFDEITDGVDVQDEIMTGSEPQSSVSSDDQVETNMTYRYYCPACSGTAFICENKQYFEGECRSCHAALERDENNYIQR